MTNHGRKKPSMDTQQFRDLAERLSNAGRWGPDDEAGALRHLTPAVRLAAIQLVTDGVVVGCGAKYVTGRESTQEFPGPASLELSFDKGPDWVAVNDRLVTDLHGVWSPTHLDALGHFYFDRCGYNDRPQPDDLGHGLRYNSIEPAYPGVITRGILVDLPRTMGREFLAPGEYGTRSDVERALATAGLEPRPGDALLIRTGRPLMQEMIDMAGSPGLSIDCVDWVRGSEFSLIVTDAGLDVAPSQVEGVATPWHILTLARMGIRLVDAADLEQLAVTCLDLRRWEFLLVVAPLRLVGASSSPVNPLAIF